MTVRATFSFDRREHYRAIRQVFRRTPARFVPWLFALLGLALAYWNALRYWDTVPMADLIWNALPWLLITAFWVVLIPYLHWRAARTTARSDPSVQGPQLREIDDAGVHSLGNGVRLDLPWNILLKAVETDEFFLYFYSKQLAFYVPKRVLPPADVQAVRVLTQAKLGARAQLQSS